MLRCIRRSGSEWLLAVQQASVIDVTNMLSWGAVNSRRDLT